MSYEILAQTQSLPQNTERLSNRAQLEMLLDTSCGIFRRCITEIQKNPEETRAIIFEDSRHPSVCCTRAAIEIAARIVDFSMRASTAISYNLNNPGQLPAIKLSASLEDRGSPLLSPKWILDYTRRFTRELLDKLDREPFGATYQLAVPYPPNDQNRDEILLAARVAAAIMVSDFGSTAFNSTIDETNWREGGQLLISATREDSLSTPNSRVDI
jgi:hypothetical protein